jgi:hypothetical protein
MRRLVLIAQFVGHQLFSTFLISFLTGIAVVEFFSIAHSAGSWVQVKTAHRWLTENHVFALQWANALVLGYVLHWKFRQRPILWVWAIPAAVFTYFFVTWNQASVFDSTSANRIAHFFGSGCDVHRRCFDQIMLTLPLYCSIAYSVGGWLQTMTSTPAEFPVE